MQIKQLEFSNTDESTFGEVNFKRITVEGVLYIYNNIIQGRNLNIRNFQFSSLYIMNTLLKYYAVFQI